MDNLRIMIGVGGNDRIRELVSVPEKVDEAMNESPMRRYGHMKIMEENLMVKRLN